MDNQARLEQVERWALYCKDNLKDAQKQVNAFVDAQLVNSNNFYKRLAKTKNGRKKILLLKKTRFNFF